MHVCMNTSSVSPQVTNGSLCTVHYAWSCFEDDTVKVTVEPPEGSIGKQYATGMCTNL